MTPRLSSAFSSAISSVCSPLRRPLVNEVCLLCSIRASSSGSRWKARQGKDSFARAAKVQGLKSRAAFKLLEMDAKYRLFRRGQTVVDLGYAPGSWSQVAKERTKPTGLILGIDLIPAQPPKGVSTIQGNFLSPDVQALVKQFLAETPKAPPPALEGADGGEEVGGEGEVLVTDRPSYIDLERQASHESETESQNPQGRGGRLVDVVLSDMLMNTSGNAFRDHAGSMDLCVAALSFANDTLKAGGHFVCKFYQGKEDKALENRLKKLFNKVHREKPESSRNESREAYFIALRRKGDVVLDDISLS